MTDFSQLELLYSQFNNLTAEIKQLIEKESYEDATSKVKSKDKLIKKIALTKKTVKLTPEETEKMNTIEETVRAENKELIETLILNHKELSSELNNTKKKVKINSAYDISTKNRTGKLIDTLE